MGDCFEDDFDDTTMFENKSGLAEVILNKFFDCSVINPIT